MRIVGIDFGTHNTLIALREDDQIRLLTQKPIPSRICWEGRLTPCQEGGVTGFKRYVQQEKAYTLGGKDFTAEELVTAFLQSLRQAHSFPLGMPSVLSVPSAYDYAQREALRSAAEKAGWKIIRMIEEPVAALIAGFLQEQYAHASILLLDLGAGTMDASILDIDGSLLRVSATAGRRFGGMDADRIVAEHTSLPMSMARELRETLSMLEEGRVTHEGKDVLLTRDELERLLQPPLEEALQDLLDELLQTARMRAYEIDTVLLTGGFSQTPLVKRLITLLLDREPYPIDPYTAVVRGSLLSLGLPNLRERAGVRITLGMHPKAVLITPDMPLPASGETILTTREDHATHGLIPVKADERVIGILRIPLLPGEAGSSQVRVHALLPEDGLLRLEAEDLATGTRLHATFHPTRDGEAASSPTLIVTEDAHDPLASLHEQLTRGKPQFKRA